MKYTVTAFGYPAHTFSRKEDAYWEFVELLREGCDKIRIRDSKGKWRTKEFRQEARHNEDFI